MLLSVKSLGRWVMASKWPSVPLSELSTVPVTYGVVQPGTHAVDGMPMLRVNNFQSGALNLADVMRIAPDVESKYGRTRIHTDDVLITIVGSVGQVAVVPAALNGWNIARAVAMIRPSAPELSRWISFVLRSPDAQHQLGVAANTTVQTTINLKDLRALQIPLPDKNTRAEISETLGALDDRIDNLRQTNATLEAIAAALFKSRFVDFDGVPPEGMQESELGLIPKGWRTYTFGEIAALGKGTVNPAAQSQRVFSHYSLPAFDAGQMPISDVGEAIKSNKTPVPSGAVLVSKLNPHIPRIWFVGEAGENAVCSTEFLVWTPKPGVGSAFVYFVATSPEFNATMLQLVTGTSNSHQRVRPEQLEQAHAAIASEASIAAFDEAATPLLRRIVHNRRQAATLAALRDTLLPRLISGQLRVSQ